MVNNIIIHVRGLKILRLSLALSLIQILLNDLIFPHPFPATACLLPIWAELFFGVRRIKVASFYPEAFVNLGGITIYRFLV